MFSIWVVTGTAHANYVKHRMKKTAAGDDEKPAEGESTDEGVGPEGEILGGSCIVRVQVFLAFPA